MGTPEFKKQTWTLFKMNRSSFNTADRKINKILARVFEMGVKEGKREQTKAMQIYLNGLNKK